MKIGDDVWIVLNNEAVKGKLVSFDCGEHDCYWVIEVDGNDCWVDCAMVSETETDAYNKVTKCLRSQIDVLRNQIDILIRNSNKKGILND